MTKEQHEKNLAAFKAAQDKAVKDHLEKFEKSGVLAAMIAQTKATNAQAKAITALTKATLTSSDKVTSLLDKAIDDAYPDDDGEPDIINVQIQRPDLSHASIVAGLCAEFANVVAQKVGPKKDKVIKDLVKKAKDLSGSSHGYRNQNEARLNKVDRHVNMMDGNDGDNIDRGEAKPRFYVLMRDGAEPVTGAPVVVAISETSTIREAGRGHTEQSFDVLPDGCKVGAVSAYLHETGKFGFLPPDSPRYDRPMGDTDGDDGEQLDANDVDDTPEYMRYTKDHSFRKEPAHTEAAKNALKVGKILASVGGYDGSRIDVSYAATPADFKEGGTGITTISDAPKHDYIRFVKEGIGADDIAKLDLVAANSGTAPDMINLIRVKSRTSPNEARKAFFELTLLSTGAALTYKRMKDQDKYPSRVTPAELAELGQCMIGLGLGIEYIKAAMISASVYPKSQSDIGVSTCTVNGYIRDGISKLDANGQEQLYVQFVTALVEASYKL